MHAPTFLSIASSAVLVASMSGCSSSLSPAPDPDTGAPAARELRTIVDGSDGRGEDLGTKKYTEATIKFFKLTRIRGISINENGEITSYVPIGYSEGVAAAPEGSPLDFEVLDSGGMVVEWRASSKPVLNGQQMWVLADGFRGCGRTAFQATLQSPLKYDYDPVSRRVRISSVAMILP